jgi:SAM-dependent methyltransferase
MQDEKFISKYSQKIGGPVLELASGTGRLSKVILEEGLDYTGIDLSKEFNKVTQSRFKGKGEFFLDDMRDFNLKKKFKFVFIGFNSFLHNLTNIDAAKTIECVSNHMLDNGVFLLSIYLPDPSFLIRDQKTLYPATDFFLYKSSQCRIMENNNYDENSSINTLFWYLEIDGVLQEEKYSFKQKMYYPHEMDILFENSSLNIMEKLGSYNGSKMNDSSTMQIYICEKST